ncbi:polymorphic Outer membrane protein G/I family [Ectocarpus siliculosus]|uniref:Polymorphic Outer membrane protein G/I family n=1 Tax=Ectocarpus siliculosus TaxID=2880 RepID=D8LSC1_ECTSI|nr:polymorphic Outer membrane protein G/I family [Ectocarpus siliculosus]|eukprot:CBN75178.1 polymorphic Outer membrane protein G/I family [Ectocarpus siliculosus]
MRRLSSPTIGFAASALTILCLLRSGIAQYDSCTGGNVTDIGNGNCDAVLNVASCGYDGGDCCSCTCNDGPFHLCADSDFDCVYPECGDPAVTSSDAVCDEDMQGDGMCNEENNSAACGYDGGDCCECSCVDGPLFECGSFSIFGCRDPACYDPALVAEFPDCTGDWFKIGDGACNPENNIASCGYDGGDGGELDCVDPSAPEELYECEAPPITTTPCPADSEWNWVVGDSEQALALALAINCSGGSFEVEWVGTVVVNETIFVTDGTVLTITGAAGSNAALDGNSATRLFTVVNAALHVSGINISHGASISGAAIAAGGSTLTFNQTNFIGNVASGNGGAVFVSDGSLVSCADGTTFTENEAGIDGGAMYVTGGSAVSCGGWWFSNTAAIRGGAMRVQHESSASWSESAVFAGNTAGAFGGALSVVKFSSVSWDASTDFYYNSAAVTGGALSASTACSLSWSAQTGFYSNSAGLWGGAVFVYDDSNASWGGETTTVFDGNQAAELGGAVVMLGSTLSCEGNTTSTFSGNSAPDGGGLYATLSTLSFGGKSLFENNHASGNPELNGTGSGGAVYLLDSTASWVGETEIFNNSALLYGGGIAMFYSTASWEGNTTVSYNWVEDPGSDFDGAAGGGIKMFYDCNAVWGGGMTQFIGNDAAYGSAIHMDRSVGSWSGPMRFLGNSARTFGGVYIDESEVSWTRETEFINNTALSGGAIFLRNGSTASWTGDTNFTSNHAFLDGGAIVSPEFDDKFNLEDSAILINGTTSFFNNACGGNGGAVNLLGVCDLVVDPAASVRFTENAAAVAGGAVFVSGAGAGPAFANTTFTSNSAQVGGAVAVFGSGNSKGVADIEPPNPTTFERCWFLGNRATATGGAIDSAAGHDYFVDTTFEDNAAGTGGALRLAGTASINSCSFVENFSDDEGGAAVSNIGTVESTENISFSANGFDCPSGTFLGYNASADLFEAVCNGCQTTCVGCAFADPLLVPTCTDLLEHSTSSDGRDTLETLSIQAGYWRATTSGTEVLACYHADSGLGGVTGTSGYCLEGYEGPYCAVCSEGYSAQLGFTCRTCSDSAGGIALAAALAVVGLVALVAVVSYVTSGEEDGKGRGIVERVGRYIPLQSVKIVVVAWQIMTQFTNVANVTYPHVYQNFLNGLEVFNFDLSWILSAGCVVDVDFHDRLLMATVGPIFAALLLACTYAAAVRIHRGATETLENVRHKHVFMLLLTFFVYSSVSATLFRTFACETLEDGKTYLLADYRIECDSSKHKGFEVYAGFMVLLFTAGIPALYSFLLFRDRDVLKGREAAGQDLRSRATSTSDLWKPYKPSVFYYEVVECARRVLLAGVVVFIYPNSSAQIAITLALAFIFVLISEGLAPYASRWDTWINRMGHVAVVASMYLALLLKVDVSKERSSSQGVFEAVLVVAHVVMVVVVVVETLVLALALRAGRRGGQHLQEDRWPRFRNSGNVIGQSPGEQGVAHWEQENPFADHVHTRREDNPTLIG